MALQSFVSGGGAKKAKNPGFSTSEFLTSIEKATALAGNTERVAGILCEFSDVAGSVFNEALKPANDYFGFRKKEIQDAALAMHVVKELCTSVLISLRGLHRVLTMNNTAGTRLAAARHDRRARFFAAVKDGDQEAFDAYKGSVTAWAKLLDKGVTELQTNESLTTAKENVEKLAHAVLPAKLAGWCAAGAALVMVVGSVGSAVTWSAAGVGVCTVGSLAPTVFNFGALGVISVSMTGGGAALGLAGIILGKAASLFLGVLERDYQANRASALTATNGLVKMQELLVSMKRVSLHLGDHFTETFAVGDDPAEQVEALKEIRENGGCVGVIAKLLRELKETLKTLPDFRTA